MVPFFPHLIAGPIVRPADFFPGRQQATHLECESRIGATADLRRAGEEADSGEFARRARRRRVL